MSAIPRDLSKWPSLWSHFCTVGRKCTAEYKIREIVKKCRALEGLMTTLEARRLARLSISQFDYAAGLAGEAPTHIAGRRFWTAKQVEAIAAWSPRRAPKKITRPA